MLPTLLFFIISYISMTWPKWIPTVHTAYHNLWRYLKLHNLMGNLRQTFRVHPQNFQYKLFCNKVSCCSPFPPPSPTFLLIQWNCELLPKAIIPLFTITVLSHPLLCTSSGNYTAAGCVLLQFADSTKYTSFPFLMCNPPPGQWRPHKHEISINRSSEKTSFSWSPHLHQIMYMSIWKYPFTILLNS